MKGMPVRATASGGDVGQLEQDGGQVPRQTPDGGRERAAQRAAELLGRLVDAMELTPLAAVYSIDRGGVVRFWNSYCGELYGTPAAQALGRPAAQLLSYGARQAEHDALVAEVWRSGLPAASSDWQVTAGGRTRWIYAALFPVFHGGVLQQLFCMDIDISERKRDEQALLTAGANFRQMYLKSSDAILLIQQERIADVNPAAVQLFKCGGKQAMLGKRLADFSPLQQPSGELSEGLGALSAQRSHADGNCRYEWRYLNGEGELFWAEVLMTSVAFDHEHLFYVVVRDISARKHAERALYLAAQVFENSRDAILLSDRNKHIIAINRAYTYITGYGAEEMLDQPLDVHAGDEDGQDDFERQVWAEIAATEHWQGEVRARRKNGERFPAWLALTAIRDSGDHISNYMGILTDITDRKKSEEHTRHLAEHDFLTDLPNRVLLRDRLSLALAAARRHGSMLAILFLDLDRFKHINDTLGHDVGDQLLREVALRLVKCVRGIDTVSRQGGDEFVIILADVGGVDQAAHVAASVLHAIGQPYLLGAHALNVSTSIGVAIYPNDGDSLDLLIKNADIAMYHAKESGRNVFQFFNAEMNARIVERAGFENGLRQALRREEFELAFQPEIDFASGAPVACEALIRWRHPELGLLLPERFIAVAEECGLMVPIGDWVLRAACRQARRWQDAGHPLAVAVNLSAAQLMQKNLPDAVAAALAAAGLPAERLELELTEALIMKGGAGALPALRALRGLGVRLVIDDFGTGYSRLSHLKELPVDKLKIDRSFVGAIVDDGDDAAIVTTIVALARSLKLQVIAEGVETPQQLRFLRSQGCDQYQGYLADAEVRAGALAPLLAWRR